MENQIREKIGKKICKNFDYMIFKQNKPGVQHWVFSIFTRRVRHGLTMGHVLCCSWDLLLLIFLPTTPTTPFTPNTPSTQHPYRNGRSTTHLSKLLVRILTCGTDRFVVKSRGSLGHLPTPWVTPKHLSQLHCHLKHLSLQIKSKMLSTNQATNTINHDITWIIWIRWQTMR